MSLAHQQYWSNKLDQILSRFEPDEFLIGVRAIKAGYDGQHNLVGSFIRNFPSRLISSEITTEDRIYEWELETLVNECIRLPRRGAPYVQLHRKNDPRNYAAFRNAAGILRELENSEYGNSQYPVLKEMQRIAARQFEWQSGWHNRILLYRAAKLFTHPLLEARIQLRTGFSANELTYAGFAFWAINQSHLLVDQSINLNEAFLSDDMRDAAVTVFSMSMDQAVDEARVLRSKWPLIAYRPSILRRHPIIRLQSDPSKLVCPLPELIFNRVTQGLYFDVVSDEGAIRDALGESFENYVADLLNIGGAKFDREFEFKLKKNLHRSPDFMIKTGDAIRVLLECKCSKLTFGAAYEDNPEQHQGYRDLAKGVFQIWRHVSRIRLGSVAGRLANDVVGSVLTLDDWLVGSRPALLHVLNQAKRMCVESKEQISTRDQIPVIFTRCRDLELRVFSTAANESLADSFVLAASKDRYVVGPLSSLCDRFEGGVSNELLSSVLPWWNSLGQLSEARQTL